MPSLTVFGGPNGSGKSSIIRLIDFEGRENILDADAIAKRISPNAPHLAALRAGREVLNRTQEYVRSGTSFAIETTLSGGWIVTAIEEAREARFFVRLIYVCVETPEQNVQRVRERVARGGHHVPEDDVRRRYDRSLSRLRDLVTNVDQAIFYDNSGTEPRRVLEIRSGAIATRVSDLPDWLTRSVEIDV